MTRSLSRRLFIKLSGALAGGTAVLGGATLSAGVKTGQNDPDDQIGGIKVLRSACMMCNAGCGIQVKVRDGVAIKVDGNPYCPQTSEYASAGKEVVESDVAPTALGSLCARGQAGLMSLYDPMRIKYPLKRVGARGAGEWEVISWDQAIAEICYGGKLLEGSFEGLASIRNSAPIGAAESDYMDEAPATGYGPKSNQLVVLSGRNQNGAITGRFTAAFGTTNNIDHTAICNASYKTAGYHTFSRPKSSSGTYNLKPIIENADYLLLFGTNPVESNVPSNTFGRLVASFLKKGGKIVTVDPRFSNTAAKSHRWVPIKPGYDGAFALGVMRWLIDSGMHAIDYLSRTNEDAAKKDIGGLKYVNWTNSTFLISKSTHKFIDSAEAGVLSTVLDGPITKTDATVTVTDASGFPAKGTIKIGTEYVVYTSRTDTTFTGLTRGFYRTTAADAASGATVSVPFVVVSGGFAHPYTAVDQADIEFDGTVNGISCETSFSALSASVFERTVAEYEALCDIPAGTIATVAGEFATAQNPVADCYRGSQSGTNGYYNIRAINLLNVIMGRVDRAGGYAVGPRFAGADPTRPVTTSTSGVRLDRYKAKYAGAKSKPSRQWFPLGESGVHPETLASMKFGYPYKVKAMITFTNNPAFTAPYPQGQIETLKDTKALPLHIVSTVNMDETAAYADYILPDGTYFEKWAEPMTGYPTVHTRSSTIRRPVVGKFDPITKHYIPALPGTMLWDDVLIRIAVELGLPNFGLNGAGAGKDIFTAWQYYNLYFSGGAYTQGLDDKADCMRMGGRRENPAAIIDPANPDLALNKYADMLEVYYEKVGTTKNALTGAYFSGVPIFEQPHLDLEGTAIPPTAGYDLQLITFKRGWHTQSRTASNVWLNEIEPENALWINTGDAQARGIANGDLVKITTPYHTDGETGHAYVTEEIRPGVIGVSAHFGRRQAGSKPYVVDGETQAHDPSFGKGLSANHLMARDPKFPNLCMTDRVSGMAAFMSPYVKVQKQ
ncbi:MAG: hypothetical protein AMXMBFR64_56880 [Myxococcales bacterium]